MIKIYKQLWLVDLVLKIYQGVPHLVWNNLEKAKMLKNVFVNLNSDGIEGDYLEFGVAYGNTLRAALEGEKKSEVKEFNIFRKTRWFYGFDTFDGFQSNDPNDQHVVWAGNNFNLSYEKVQKRFRGAPVTLTKIDAQHLVDENLKRIEFYDQFKIKTAAAILFDMDLKAPTLCALIWARPYMQSGTYLLFDEYFGFGGNPDLGEAGAFKEFLKLNPEIEAIEFQTYGLGGKVFIIRIA